VLQQAMGASEEHEKEMRAAQPHNL